VRPSPLIVVLYLKMPERLKRENYSNAGTSMHTGQGFKNKKKVGTTLVSRMKYEV